MLAETLASLEIGNYAPAERRARVVSRDHDACEGVSVDSQLVCLAGAKSTADAESCAPGLVLDRDCGHVVEKIHAAAKKPDKVDPALEEQVERGFAVMATACDEDAWPADLKQCVMRSSSLERCTDKLPKELRDKLAKRVMDVLQP